jgi:hypothetical protein
MISVALLTTGQTDLRRAAPTELDLYAQLEFGEPNARSLLAWSRSSPEASEACDAPADVGLLRRLTQAIASFL